MPTMESRLIYPPRIQYDLPNFVDGQLRKSRLAEGFRRQLEAVEGVAKTDPSTAPEGSYRNQTGELFLDCTFHRWVHHVDETLAMLGYTNQQRRGVIVGTDYLNPEDEDFGLLDPRHGTQVRSTYAEWVAGRAASMRGGW